MKKYFPYIITLVIISCLGLVYLQIQWIEDAKEVQENQYKNEINNSMHSIREQLLHRVLLYKGFNPNVIEVENEKNIEILSDGVESLSHEDFKEIIANQLKNNKINLPFEYALLNTKLGNEFISIKSIGYRFNPYNKDASINIDRYGYLTLYVHITEPKNYILKRTSWMIAYSIILSGMIIFAFVVILYIIKKQKKVSEIKSDFINNMTHEFKTPLATISLAVDALNTPKILDQPEKIKYFSGIIKDENIRMNKQVQKILDSAKLEKDNLELNLQPIHMHEYIHQAANNTEIQVGNKGGIVRLLLNAKNDRVEGDEVHLSNIIFNLLDNALKYCDKVPEITIVTINMRNSIIIKVEDNGIGMSRETQKNVFEKFYRAHTGNIHNVKGFGLGLSYVKAVVVAHKGKIKVESTIGRGSTFIIELPILHS